MSPRRAILARGRGGMTLIELSIGLLVTSLVMGALASLWFAVARTWGQNTGSQAAALTAAHASGRMEQILRQAQFLIQYRRGSLKPSQPAQTAQLLFWRRDIWNPKSMAGQEDTDTIADGAAQLAELALIEHNPTDRRLYLYQALPAQKMTLDQRTRAGVVAPWAELTAASTPEAFKKYDFIERQVFCEAVEGAVINIPTWGRAARPGVEFTLGLARGNDHSLVYGTASLRSPTTRPR